MKLIFIHGSGGCKESWQFQIGHFVGSEAINLPGHPEGELCSTIAEYAAWLHIYIQDKGYQDVVLIGHSLGGGVALQYALDYPEKLAGIITVGSGGRLRVNPVILEGLEKVVENPSQMSNFNASVYDLIKPSLAEIIRKRVIENTPTAFLNDLKACDGFDVMERLEEITVPLLAIVGDKDVMTPPKYSAFMVDKVANALQVTIPEGTHFAFAEKPVEVNKAIEAFIQAL